MKNKIKNKIKLEIFILLAGLSLISVACQSMMEDEVPPLATEEATTYNYRVEADLNQINGNNQSVAKNEEGDNDLDGNEFMLLLDSITNVHPGTAGCSLQIMYVGAALLDMCKSKLPLDVIAKSWVSGQEKEKYQDINESFKFLLENIDGLNVDGAKEILVDTGVEKYNGPWDKAVVNTAKQVINTVIDLTK